MSDKEIEQYIYNIKCGSGSTIIELFIHNNNDTFVLSIYYYWMGNDKTKIKLNGYVKKLTPLYYTLYATEINNLQIDKTKIIFEFYKFKHMINIQEYMIEYEGMVLGGCNINNHTYKYDSMLKLIIDKQTEKKILLLHNTDGKGYENAEDELFWLIEYLYSKISTVPMITI